MSGAGTRGEEEESYGGRGDVYRWLRANYGVVLTWISDRQPSFQTIAARIAREGVVGARGRPPTRRSVWKVWRRVCRDIKAEIEAREVAQLAAEESEAERKRELLTGISLGKRHALDFGKEWKPESPDAAWKGGVPDVVASSALSGGATGPLTPAEQLAGLGRELAERSGRGRK